MPLRRRKREMVPGKQVFLKSSRLQRGGSGEKSNLHRAARVVAGADGQGDVEGIGAVAGADDRLATLFAFGQKEAASPF